MIYLLAFAAGLVLGCFVIRWDVHMRKDTYKIRIKDVKDELTHSKVGTGSVAQHKSLDAALVQSERLPI